MAIDAVTIIVCVSLLLLAVVSSWLANAFWRRPKGRAFDNGEVGQQPRFSIVIAAHDNAYELERNLPSVLSQDYEAGYEVVVVDESSTDETADVLKRLQNTYPNLYVTFIPESSHYLSRRKLALTVGVKAAKNEWVVFTSADCKPLSEKWLTALSAHCTDDKDMVLGYTAYAHDAKAFQRFYRLLTACYRFRRAQRSKAYAYGCSNLALRKSVFMERNGFLLNLKYLRGEYDFLVNEYAEADNADVAFEHDACNVQDAPSHKTWTNDHLFYMETRKHLSRGFAYRFLNNIDTLLLHVNFLAQMAAIALSIYLENWTVTVAAALCVVITLTVRMVLASKAIRAFGEAVPLWLVPLFELRVMWQRLLFKVKYAFSDKYDFIRR